MNAFTTPTLAPLSPRPLAVSLWKNFPELRARILRGVELYKSQGVLAVGPSGAIVRGSGEGVTYTVSSDLLSCSCPDHAKAPNGVCKHTVAFGLSLAAHEELPQKRPLTLATRIILPLPEKVVGLSNE